VISTATLALGSLGAQAVVALIAGRAGNVGVATNVFLSTAYTTDGYAGDAAGCVTQIVYSGPGCQQCRTLTWDSQYGLVGVSTNGVLAEGYTYDPLGRRIATTAGDGTELARSALGNRYLFQGREYSWDTGLYYFRARWYDPVTGRFLSNDPIGISGGLNMYVFAGNNPVNFRDPFGLCTDDNYPSLSQWHWYDSVYSYLWQTGRNAANYFGAPWINTYHAAGAYYDNPTLVNGCYLAQSYLPVVIAAGLAGLGPAAEGVAQPNPNGQFVVGPNGTTVRIPPGYVAEPAIGDGSVYRAPGTAGNANTIRIMAPDARNPSGYVRTYNSPGQPLIPGTSRTGSNAQTHTGL
jgi:RHS repeat-associated protein